ncbi:MAG: hypothetical protein H6739_02905 [Alphaproteobacteria bacterium]|nr:hypothetical protein [Alphaproteobacteria bacterium]
MSLPHQVRTAIIGMPPERARQLHAYLGRWMLPVLTRQDPREALPMILAARPQAVVVYVGEHRTVATQFARRVRAEVPDASLIMVTDFEDLALTREAVRLGAHALAVLGTDDVELAQVFARLAEERFEPTNAGMVVTLLGAKGGVGTTSLAINLAGCLAQNSAALVALVDLAPCVGEVGVYLDMDTPFSPGELLEDAHLFDQEFIQTRIPRHPWGFHVIAQPLTTKEPEALGPDTVLQAATLLQRTFTHLVIDAGSGINPLSLTAASFADQCILLTVPELPALVAARRRLDLLGRLGLDPQKLAVVLNRFAGTGEFDVNRVQALLQRPLSAVLSEDSRLMNTALHSGRLLLEVGPRARLAQEILALGARLGGNAEIGAPQPKRKKLFGLF